MRNDTAGKQSCVPRPREEGDKYHRSSMKLREGEYINNY